MNTPPRARRHYGIYKNNKFDVVIVGYRSTTNEVMAVLLHALPKTEREELERIVMSYDAQSVDYLLNSTGRSKSVLGSAPFIGSETKTWEDIVVTRSRNPNDQTVFNCPLDHIEFEDATQLAFYEGKGESIEPGIDRERRRNRGEEVEGDELEDALVSGASTSAVQNLTAAMQQVLEQTKSLSERMDSLEKKDSKKPAKKTAKKASKAA